MSDKPQYDTAALLELFDTTNERHNAMNGEAMTILDLCFTVFMNASPSTDMFGNPRQPDWMNDTLPAVEREIKRMINRATLPEGV